MREEGWGKTDGMMGWVTEGRVTPVEVAACFESRRNDDDCLVERSSS